MTSALTDMIEIPEKGRQNGAEEKKKKELKKKKEWAEEIFEERTTENFPN